MYHVLRVHLQPARVSERNHAPNPYNRSAYSIALSVVNCLLCCFHYSDLYICHSRRTCNYLGRGLSSGGLVLLLLWGAQRLSDKVLGSLVRDRLLRLDLVTTGQAGMQSSRNIDLR